MLSNIWILNLGCLAALILYWSIPPEKPELRQSSLTVISAIMVALYSPGGLLACAYLVLIPVSGKYLFQKHKNIQMFWVFIALALVPLVGLRLWSDQSSFFTFGVAFATVKSLGLILVAYGGRVEISTRTVALLIFYFPLFTVGPVEQLAKFREANFTNTFDPSTFIYGLYRIAIGLFLVMFVCQEILDPTRTIWFGRNLSSIENFTRMDAIGLVIVSFLYTYLNFEGFSSVAIGLSRLFGLKVIENFDRPLMITNVADFWKKYHISMGKWISATIYFPLVIWLKKSWASYAATVIAFVLFGLWHAFDLNYLVWGIGNGLGVSFVHFGKNKKIFPLIKSNSPAKMVVAVITGAISLFYVAWLQTFANLDAIGTSIALTRKLLTG